ncbi:MAG: ABC transporter ATP-binding protein [Oscillospiraceae bacterium]
MSLVVEKLNINAKMKGGTTQTIVSDLSFSINHSEKLAIVGRSGCGKTMTAMAILGLLPYNCSVVGSILWNGAELLTLPEKTRRELRGTQQVLIPQSGSDFLNPVLRVKRQMYESIRRTGVSKSKCYTAERELLSRVGFDEPSRVLRAYPFQLSGGMAQRVVMAMALAGRPQLVIADEPTRGVDQANAAKFISQLNELFADAAVLIITHDISVAAQCDRILVIDDGKMVEIGEAEQIIKHPREPYTHKLICDLPHALSHAEGGHVDGSA